MRYHKRYFLSQKSFMSIGVDVYAYNLRNIRLICV